MTTRRATPPFYKFRTRATPPARPIFSLNDAQLDRVLAAASNLRNATRCCNVSPLTCNSAPTAATSVSGHEGTQDCPLQPSGAINQNRLLLVLL
jgi:hypothetical protein